MSGRAFHCSLEHMAVVMSLKAHFRTPFKDTLTGPMMTPFVNISCPTSSFLSLLLHYAAAALAAQPVTMATPPIMGFRPILLNHCQYLTAHFNLAGIAWHPLIYFNKVNIIIFQLPPIIPFTACQIKLIPPAKRSLVSHTHSHRWLG